MSFESLPSTIRNELVDICDEFEIAWRAGRRPRIEEYLGSRTTAQRDELLMMLVGVELEMRRRAGEPLETGEYSDRFGLDAEAVRTMLDDPTEPGLTEPNLPLSTLSRADLIPLVDASTTRQVTTVHVPRSRGPDPVGPTNIPMPDRIGRYRVTAYLGCGNFLVYRARDDLNGRDVAIKIAKPVNTSGRRLVSLAEEAEKLKAAPITRESLSCTIMFRTPGRGSTRWRRLPRDGVHRGSDP